MDFASEGAAFDDGFSLGIISLKGKESTPSARGCASSLVPFFIPGLPTTNHPLSPKSRPLARSVCLFASLHFTRLSRSTRAVLLCHLNPLFLRRPFLFTSSPALRPHFHSRIANRIPGFSLLLGPHQLSGKALLSFFCPEPLREYHRQTGIFVTQHQLLRLRR